ncbi:PilC family type IV pilus tip adhesin [Neisseria lactamica]|uniref:PilC family type IV pilus tip adhesin n=1 Tax=Neisseria lactamica TaxID=486 RepID=UPI000E592291|nr:PilC family type IV pilus tip adhesin [Neisseria lactamica]
MPSGHRENKRKENDMKKTPKRHLLRHTAVYTAMLLAVSSQQAFGVGDTANFNFIVNDDGSVKGDQTPGNKGVRTGKKETFPIGSSTRPGRNICRELGIKFDATQGCPFFAATTYELTYANTDTLLAGKTGGKLILGGGSAPLWGKVSGLDADNMAGRKTDNWLTTVHKGKMGYDFTGLSCFLKGLSISTGQSRQCPNLPFQFFFDFTNSALDSTSVGTSPDGLPIYKLTDHPWLGVSFQLALSDGKTPENWLAIQRDHTEVSKMVTQPTGERSKGQVFALRAKLHMLGNSGSLNAQEIKLGEISMPNFAFMPHNENGNGRTATIYKVREQGHIDVKLQLPNIGAGGCTRAQYTAAGPDGSQYAIVAPAPLGAGFPGRAAAVVTDPKSASSRILFYTLDKNNKKNGGADYLPSKGFTEPVFAGRKAAIRLANGVSLSDSNINGITNGTFGIGDNGNNQQEWKDVLLRWTDRRDANDNQFNHFNNAIDASTRGKLYSQQYRIRDDKNRNLGDIVNSPVTAVGDYLATAANDGMVHIFKKSGGGYNLKLSYIPGTMPRKNLDNQDSDLAKDLHNFANENYTGGLYGVDGGFVLRQAGNRVFMFGAMGQGGKGAYALDLTKADSNQTGVSLFDVQGNGLGYTVGTPQIGKTHNGKYAAFLSSGYAVKDVNSGDNTTALYVYDLESNGTLIKKIDVPGGKGGLSSPTLVDTDLDGTVDIAYAGDRGGKMYRFDLGGNDPTRWSVRAIFNGTKPITSAPAISQLKDKRVVIFGTGSDLTEEDVASQEIQHVYGIFDNDTDSLPAEDGLGKGLLEQVLTKDSSTLFLSDYKRSDGSGDKGWVVKLEAGQRVTVKPTVVLRTAFVTIRNYNANGCGAETAFLGINTADGGRLTKKSARPVVPDSRVAKKVGEKKDAKGNNIPVGCMEKGTETVCPSGYVYPKLLTASYLDSQKTNDHPTTADGDAGGSGNDNTPFQKSGNRCFFSKGVHTLLMNDMSDLDVAGPICNMKRVSWREVFF